MSLDSFEVKPGTRNHQGFFIQETSYKLIDIDNAGWALICMNDAVCYYVDPDNLQQEEELDRESRVHPL